MPGKSVAIRLSTVGKSEVKNDFDEIASAGEGTAKRLTETYEQQAAAAERAAERAAQTAAKIAAIAPQTALQMQIGSATGSNFGADFEGSARRSAAAMKDLLAEQDEMIRRGNAIRGVIDPLWAAQERYNQALSEARTLAAAKILSDDELIQREQQLKVAFEQESAAMARGGQSLGARRAAVQQLGFQINDIAQGIALGTAPQVLFAQQAGQTAQAIQLMGGQAKGFGAFLSGPWGIAISAGVVILASFLPLLLQTRDAVAKATEELKKQAQAHEEAGKAAIAFAHTEEGVHDALLKAEEARQKATDGLLSHAEAQNVAAKQSIENTDKILDQAEAYLKLRRAQLQAAQGTTFGAGGAAGAAGAQDMFLRGVTDLEKDVAKLRADRAGWEAELEASRADLAAEAAKRMTDPVERIKRLYEGPGGLIEQAKNRALAEHQVNTELTKQLFLLNQQEQAKIKAAQDAQRDASRKPNFGRDIAEDGRADLLDAAKRYSGLSEHRDKSALEALFKQAGESVDPEMVKWCAAFVNAVLATQGLKGTGSLAARSFLGFGTATNSPTAGDIVVSSHQGQDHVGFFEGFDAKGNVRLFSGNTSDRVGESVVAKGDVLSGGFRRAPTDAQSFAAQADAEKKAADEMVRLLAEVDKIEDGFNPASKAADELREKIDKLREAAAKGVITPEREALDENKAWAARLEQDHPTKIDKSVFDQQAARFDETMAQWTQEDQVHWKAVEDAANKAGQIVLDNLNELKDAGEGLVDTLFNPSNWRSWGDLGKSVLHEIEAELIKLAAINPLKNLITGGHLPTLLSSITNLFGGKGETILGGSDKIIGHNAAGSEYWSGGMTVVGEFGPELANLPTGTRITPASRTRQMLGGANDNPPPVSYNFDFRGTMVTEDVLRFAMTQADRAAVRGAAGGSQMAQDALARRGRQSLAGF